MHIFISPHPDDASLSCGGLIHHLTHAGESVLIITTMGGNPPTHAPDTPLIRELHARWGLGAHPSQVRRDEDAAAAKVLGADIRFLDLPDCIYRRGANGEALYPTGAELFAPYRVGTDIAQDVGVLMIAYGDVLKAATRVYFPLAVGNHVDHQIAHGWAGMFSAEGVTPEQWFYEDYPYSAVEGSREKVLGAFSPNFVKRYDMMLSPNDVHAKIDSIRCYESQLSTFWPNWETMAAQVTDFLTAGGTRSPMETYWIREG